MYFLLQCETHFNNTWHHNRGVVSKCRECGVYPLVNTPDAHIYLNAIFSSLPFTKQGDHKGTLRQCLYGKMDRSAAVVIGKIFSRQLRMWTWSVGSSPALEVVILAEVGRE